MATRQAACHWGNFAWRSRAIRLPSPSVTVFPVNVGPEAPSGCRRRSRRIKYRSSAASATSRESRTSRTEKSTSSISALTADRRSSTRNRRSQTGSSSRSARSPTRRFRRRRSRATTLAVITGWGCPTRSSVTPPSSGIRCDLSTTQAGTRGGGQGPRAHRGPPRPGIPLLQRVVLREPRGPHSRRHRAPTRGNRQVGGLSRHGERGLRLRSHPRRARVRGTDPPRGASSQARPAHDRPRNSALVAHVRSSNAAPRASAGKVTRPVAP